MVRLDRLAKRFGPVHAVEDVSFGLVRGEGPFVLGSAVLPALVHAQGAAPTLVLVNGHIVTVDPAKPEEYAKSFAINGMA